MRRTRRGIAALGVAALLGGGAGAQVWEVGGQVLRPEPRVPDGDFRFGSAAVAADFDLDGDDDLVVAAPLGDSAAPPIAEDAGWVYIYWGARDRRLTQATWMAAVSEFGALGWSLAAGDFDGDGRPELAIGYPGAIVAGLAGAGAVWVQRYDGSQWVWAGAFDQETPGVPGAAEEQDLFGHALAVGDFDGDGRDDLAVGVSYEDWSGLDEGAVVVLYGSATGLGGDGSQLFGAGQGGLLGVAGDEDSFGAALASGDFDRDGFDDLAVGAPFRDVAGLGEAGQVHVIYGSAAGLDAAGNQLFGDVHFGGVTEASDFFGYALAAGNFDRPAPATCASNPPDACADDLAIGVIGQDFVPPGGPAQSAAGRVIVARGRIDDGLGSAGAIGMTQQEMSGATPEALDQFGLAFAVGQLDARRGAAGAHRADDLVVGVPYEDVGANANQGVLHLVFGGASGPGGHGDQLQLQRAGYASAPPSANDLFAFRLASGDFDGDGWGDLAVGIPLRADGAEEGVGAVQILYGALFADGTERGDTSGWSSASP